MISMIKFLAIMLGSMIAAVIEMGFIVILCLIIPLSSDASMFLIHVGIIITVLSVFFVAAYSLSFYQE